MKIITGDIFKEFEVNEGEDPPIKVLVHQANCFHTMGSGIARVIREKFPQAFVADQKTTHGVGKLGTYSTAIIAYRRFIVNLYGQGEFGRDSRGDRDTSYDAFYDALKLLFTWMERDGRGIPYEILIPYGIASNLAGARWPIIAKMIEVLEADYKNVSVTIVRLEDQGELN